MKHGCRTGDDYRDHLPCNECEPDGIGTDLPSSVPSGPAQSVVVSGEFIRALRQAGARESVIEILEKELDEEQTRRAPAALSLALSSEKRIQELLENGDRLIAEARAERAAHEKTRAERDVWRERALAFKASLERCSVLMADVPVYSRASRRVGLAWALSGVLTACLAAAWTVLAVEYFR